MPEAELRSAPTLSPSLPGREGTAASQPIGRSISFMMRSVSASILMIR